MRWVLPDFVRRGVPCGRTLLEIRLRQQPDIADSTLVLVMSSSESIDHALV